MIPADVERAGRLISIERWALGLGAAASLFALVWLDRGLAWGIAIGSVLMALNAIAMRRLGEKIWAMVWSDTQGGRARPARAIILFNLKMGALIATIYVVVKELHVNPIGLLVGLSVYPVATVAMALTHVPTAETGDPAPPTGPHLEDRNG